MVTSVRVLSPSPTSPSVGLELRRQFHAAEFEVEDDRRVRQEGHDGLTDSIDRPFASLRERIFGPGATLDWNELLVHATGEGLTSRFFVEEFVES